MLDFTSKTEELKNQHLVKFEDFKIMFNETSLYFSGVLKGKTRRIGLFTFGTFFIPTENGYVSSEWKKTELFKMGRVEVTEAILSELEPFLQAEEPNTFVHRTGTTVACAIAHHVNDSGSMLEEYLTQ
jgi:hypothetical protein